MPALGITRLRSTSTTKQKRRSRLTMASSSSSEYHSAGEKSGDNPTGDGRHTVIGEMTVTTPIPQQHRGLFEERQHAHTTFATGIDPAPRCRRHSQGEAVRLFRREDQLARAHHMTVAARTIGFDNGSCAQSQRSHHENRSKVLFGSLEGVPPIRIELLKRCSAVEPERRRDQATTLHCLTKAAKTQ